MSRGVGGGYTPPGTALPVPESTVNQYNYQKLHLQCSNCDNSIVADRDLKPKSMIHFPNSEKESIEKAFLSFENELSPKTLRNV